MKGREQGERVPSALLHQNREPVALIQAMDTTTIPHTGHNGNADCAARAPGAMTSAEWSEMTPEAAALAYAQRGFLVLPVRAGEKRPLRRAWQAAATCDGEALAREWRLDPLSGVGLTPQPGCFVLDVDTPGPSHAHNGAAALAEIEATHGPLPPTVEALTGSGGRHLWLRTPDGSDVSNGRGALPKGLDVRGSRKGFVVAPPTLHPNGTPYRWRDGYAPGEVEIAPAPAWLLEKVRTAHVVPQAARAVAGGPVARAGSADQLRRARGYLASIPGAVSGRGGHNQTWKAAAAMVRGFDLPQDIALDLLRSEYNPRCIPPWTEEELRHKVSDAADKCDMPRGYLLDGEGSLRHAPHASPSTGATTSNTDASLGPAGSAPGDDGRPAPILGTDADNACRFVRLHGQDLRFCPEWGKWLVWIGARWAQDGAGLAVFRARAVAAELDAEARALDSEAACVTDNDRRKAMAARGETLHRAARRASSTRGIQDFMRLAQSEPGMAVRADELDRDPMLLNVENGTLDLRSGALRPADRRDLLTKTASVAYDPAADCPAWHAFLRRIFGGDNDLIGFVQRAFGYCLTGDVSEQVLFVCWGTGANGKSVLLNVLQDMLGEYASPAPPDLLVMTPGEAHPTGLASLHGARAVVGNETEAGARWAESRVKWLTGGDMLTARRMREDFWKFKPTHKLWVASNFKPAVRGGGPSFWRRLRLIPFAVTIPDGEQDPRLGERLRAELPGILAWAVDGARQWLAGGLGQPEAVRAAVADYRDDSDVLGRFLAERCEVAPGLEASVADLHSAFVSWAQDEGLNPIGRSQFGIRLKERGFKTRRSTAGRSVALGLALNGARRHGTLNVTPSEGTPAESEGQVRASAAALTEKRSQFPAVAEEVRGVRSFHELALSARARTQDSDQPGLALTALTGSPLGVPQSKETCGLAPSEGTIPCPLTDPSLAPDDDGWLDVPLPAEAAR